MNSPAEIFQRYFLFLSVASAILASLVFVPALGGGFMLDDGINILQNYLLYVDEFSAGALRDAALSFHGGNGERPLPMLSFALDYWRAGGMEPLAFKVTNLLIHILTTIFMSFFLRRLLKLLGWSSASAAWGAIAFSLVWAVHPLQVSSVMYVVQRMQTMATMFIVLAMWAYIAMRQAQLSGAGRGRLQGVMVLFCGFLALACKEDAPLIFAYVLVIECVALRFSAADPKVSTGLKQSFALMTVVAIVGYALYIVPNYWNWGDYPGRGFSTLERLLTQARVLVMYLGQIIFPWPNNMTFLYDDFTVSAGLFTPWTTLPALVIVLVLIICALKWRNARPLFSLGVLIFFSGHVITSNVIPLELVFEHRNHFPLIGVVLAVGDLFLLCCRRLKISRWGKQLGIVFIILLLGSATMFRGYAWGEPVRLGHYLVDLAPESSRAWTQLGGAYYDRYKLSRDPADLEKAVEVNQAGLRHVQAPSLASNVVIYKIVLGDNVDEDWWVFQNVLKNAPPGLQNMVAVATLMENVKRDIGVDVNKVVESIYILVDKQPMRGSGYLRLGYFVYSYGSPKQAIPLFMRYAKKTNANDQRLMRVVDLLEQAGLTEEARQIQANAL
ncbi:hypothetical protein [Gilvimarinus xylanilyticus]|uniref:Pilus assembly protein PilF n=1 Tax=Gilvimarinus xylanilyticus TaxID=2944139 RepID=A0A9X2I152_9GAMM|nr:hypothetical protein [Gilvimarinus xylanilyticus]MCP8900226.1 hypothetical protein [Gilvimarinus xylanilyticus]